MFSFKVAFANFYQHRDGFYKFALIDILIEVNLAIKLNLAKLGLSIAHWRGQISFLFQFREALDTPPA